MIINWNLDGALDAYIADSVENDGLSINWPDGDFTVEVYDNYQPMFTSATWSVTVKINGKIVTSSLPVDKPHSINFINRWGRQVIRDHKKWMKSIGVNIEAEYRRLGGDPEDLNEY